MLGLSDNGSAIDKAFAKAEAQRAALAGRIQFTTPDPYFNTVGGALAVAADGVWMVRRGSTVPLVGVCRWPDGVRLMPVMPLVGTTAPVSISMPMLLLR